MEKTGEQNENTGNQPRAYRDAFKEKRTEFIRNNIDNVRLFVNGGMDKKEALLFTKSIRSAVGYSNKCESVVIKRLFTNALKEFEFLKTLRDM